VERAARLTANERERRRFLTRARRLGAAARDRAEGGAPREGDAGMSETGGPPREGDAGVSEGRAAMRENEAGIGGSACG
jgi:hypothetical protein